MVFAVCTNPWLFNHLLCYNHEHASSTQHDAFLQCI